MTLNTSPFGVMYHEALVFVSINLQTKFEVPIATPISNISK